MKKWIQRATAGAFAAALLSSTAFAADFTHCADALRDMELFIGTKHGYELERTPTRAEAAVMLVRLLGQEDTAKSKTYKTPFRDVPKWAAPYVGWLYENQLTVGMSETKFGTTALCNAQQYATFLLRTLGYADGDGYTYKTALDYAKTLGVIDAVNYDSKKFLRDHMVAMSYTALSREVKSDEGMLLDTLIAQGSVNANKAAHTKTLFDNNNTYTQLRAQEQGKAQSYTLSATVSAANGAEIAYTGKAVTEGKDLAAELRHNDALMVGIYQKGGVRHQFINGKTSKLALIEPKTIPVSAILELTQKNDIYAFSLAPAVLNQTMQGASLGQVSYSAKVEGNGVGQQIARIQINMPVGGKKDTYKIEMRVEPTGDLGSIFVPDGMEI